MKIIEKPIDEIKPYPNNPRIITEEAIAATAASIREFGFQEPIVIDVDGTIAAGHTRLAAAKRLGLKTVPCKVMDDTPAKVQGFRLADNKTHEFSDWDYEKLSEELDGLMQDFDMSEFGFEQISLDNFEAPKEFKEYDEEIETNNKCPKCGYEW